MDSSEYGIHLRVQLFNSVTKIYIPDGALKACLHMDFKTSVQLQRPKNVSKTFETHGPPRGRSFR